VPEVSVIVPARDATATLQSTLDALAGQSLAPDRFEVIVVDDASIDGTAALAREAGARVLSASGKGPAAARNAGARVASGEILAFTDADCAPAAGWLEAALEALREADLVQGAVRPPPGAAPGPFDRTLWVQAEHGLYESANLFVRREVFDRLGGFESWLRPRRGIELGEDTLLGWSAHRAGARVAFAPEAVVHHAVHPRSAADYVAERARLRYFPALVARIPELRDQFAYRRFFLSAAFDLALVGLLVALACRRRRPLALTLVAPYAAVLASDARRWGVRLGPRVALAGVAADGVGAAALACGSVEARMMLL